ncbi:MAG: ATP-binding protein [Deltaproteobacteria bacterium]|nr:ATP-binding protein [Deltaproteobacteria bacterium]
MFQRLLRPILGRSFFLFGARGTGKTTWIESEYRQPADRYLNLLDDETERRYSRKPGLLDSELTALKAAGRLPRSVIIDEVQKIPKLLDVAQKWIHREKLPFVFTGSSSRKLKRGFANLLGGRANNYVLHPLTSLELGGQFDLQRTLEWGTLPECWLLNDDREKKGFLRSYCGTYLKEEILVEQLVRKLPPFRDFLEILAQHNGKLLNFESLGKDVGVDHKTIVAYLGILEDTYLGTLVRPHHPSLRKSQLQQPRFYFFDQGVKRQLDGTLGVPLVPSTGAYGEAFESWLINETIRLCHYFELDYRFSFYRSKGGAEIDFILSRAKKRVFIEFKSTQEIDVAEAKEFSRLTDGLGAEKKSFYVSRDPNPARILDVSCVSYSDFLRQLSTGKI